MKSVSIFSYETHLLWPSASSSVPGQWNMYFTGAWGVGVGVFAKITQTHVSTVPRAGSGTVGYLDVLPFPTVPGYP